MAFTMTYFTYTVQWQLKYKQFLHRSTKLSILVQFSSHRKFFSLVSFFINTFMYYLKNMRSRNIVVYLYNQNTVQKIKLYVYKFCRCVCVNDKYHLSKKYVFSTITTNRITPRCSPNGTDIFINHWNIKVTEYIFFIFNY